MVNALGSGYVMEYCISAFAKEKKAERYQYYMSDAAYLTTNGLYSALGGEPPLPERYCEPYKPKPTKKKETADEIINRIRNGLKGIQNGCI